MRRPLAFLCLAAVAVAQQDYGNYGGDYGGDYGGSGGGGGGGGESYQDYAGQDNDGLYANYAAKKQDGGGGGGGGLPKLFLAAGFGWFAGARLHTARATKKLKKQHQKEQKKLYTQYYTDTQKLQEANAELQYTAEYLKKELERTQKDYDDEKTQRDYEEFKQPDIDGDDRISKAEFNLYIKDYLANYPGLKPEDYPRFEDFDHDNDGYINFQEYSQQMLYQTKQAEQETMEQARRGNVAEAQKANYKANALGSMTMGAQQSDNFDDLYDQYYRSF